ncbi:hypothetical protein K458DRAFT_371081 [Lentithecium fluviatile CBS 122367]|uniref:MYND-type domain-containing protein n=1 Tax=Lentithecium fluviatile CBS 122367 TaxID=1168545 RepID=A0A6G1IUC3_9PLEO|nr:hypothetical protein K458DRAFT_371081 [Lentithecium fluviatile CBS 122367]
MPTMNESFDWNYPGLNWSHFHSLANLLSLRNGGQAEPSSLSDTVLEEDWDPDDNGDGDAASMDTRLAHQISDSGHGRLKRRFLDGLAEFAANKKGGTAVACSAMKEAEDNVVIWIARNEGFSDVDKPAFDRLAKLLGSLSCNNADQSESLLWEEMVMYHQNRIEHSYIPNLRASFKTYDAGYTKNDTSTPENSSVAGATLSVLRDLLFNPNINGTRTLEKHTRLIIASYNLRRTRNVEEVLYSSPSATSRSKSLWLNICLLARLRVAFQNFKDIALTLPSFEQVTITLVPRPLAPANPSQRPLNLTQTFSMLQLDLSPATTKAVLGQNWTVAKIEREFAKRQKQKANIHAEVQMLMFLNTNESSASGLFPYFGCSKLSCFMCNRFIQSYGRFTTRGCHGRLFKPWTVPSVDRLLHGQADRTAKALMSVQKEVKKKLKASVEGHIWLERTSVIGGSSVLGGRQEERSQRQLQIERLRMKAERNRVAEMFRRQTMDTIGSTRCTYSTPEGDELENECDICMRPTTRRCTSCNKGFFCSESCQEKRSGSHLFTCSKRPLTSADYLWKSLAEDLMPQEEDVLEDFGFNNVLSGGDRSYLLGLYKGLYLSDEFQAEDIHEWRVGGILADKIKEFYYDIPEYSRGQYFPWFLQNLHVLERPMTKDEAQEKLIATFYDKARPYLDIEDRNKTAGELEPEAKAASYNLLAEMLLRITPNPMEKTWYTFGFVTCHGNREESELLGLYQLLLTESDGSFFYKFHNSRRGDFQPATFTQFWKAYEAGTLIQLMDSKGLKELRSRLPFLEDFLSVPPAGSRPSVWDLKQFIEVSEPMDYPPIPPVCVDYGFINCRTFEETCTLMEIYGSVLKTANPLELHQACVAGDLFRFASGHVRMEERWRPLMRNFYPLKEVVEPELEPEPELELELGSGVGSEVGLEANEDSAGLSSLFSRLWGFIGGFAN